MEVPVIVESALDGEDVAASVSLGGEDGLFVTPTRTLVYRSESLLSDESVEEYPHDAERVTLNEGRRKTRITLGYSIDGERDFAVPSSVTNDVLHPVLAGVLNGSGITSPGETVVQTFRFSELTLIVTSERLVKHVGSAVWDVDHEEYHFEDVTGLDFEEGSVATQIVIEVDGRPQRIKTPNDHVAEVRERLSQALFAYYDVDSLEEFNALVDPEEEAAESTDSPVDFGEGVDPLGADSSGDRPADTSGDPFLEDEETEPLVTDDDGGADAEASAEAEADPRRPVSSGNDSATSESANESGGTAREDSTSARNAQSSDAGASGAGSSKAGSRNAGSRNARSSNAGSSDGSRRDAGGSAGSGTGATGTEAESRGTGGGEETSGATDASGGEQGDTGEFEAAGFEPATANGVDNADLAARIESLEARVDAQNDLLERQQSLIEQLIQELREY